MIKYVISVPFWNYLSEENPSFAPSEQEAGNNNPKPFDKLFFKKNPPLVNFKNVNFLREILSFKNKDISLFIGVVEESNLVPGNEVRKFIYNELKLSFNFYNFLDEKSTRGLDLIKTKAGEVMIDLSKYPEITTLEALLSKLSTLDINMDTKKPLFKTEVCSIVEISNTLDYKPLAPHFVKYLYGSKNSLVSFSYLLSRTFYEKYKELVGKTDFVVTSYKNKMCPLPCSKLRNLFCENFNIKGNLIESLDFKPFVPTNIITREVLVGKTLVFVEDVSTDLSRFLIEKSLINSGYEGKVIFLNLINYTGLETKYEVLTSLGLGSLSGVSLLKILPDNKSFISININLVKYLLSCNTNSLLEFLSRDLDLSFTRKLYNYIILEGLNKEPSENLEIIKRTIKPLL